jgi:EAL domain-containing protein (putative c-di-GMP-specific phosphodiesterase class I)
VLGLSSDDSDAMIVRSTIELGHHLGLQVVAEGAESPGVWAELARMGCDSGQGFHISRPLPPEAFERWLHERAARMAETMRERPWAFGPLSISRGASAA